MEIETYQDTRQWLLDNGFIESVINDSRTLYSRKFNNIVFNITYETYGCYYTYKWFVCAETHKQNFNKYKADTIDSIKSIIKLYFIDIKRNDIIDDLLSPS